MTARDLYYAKPRIKFTRRVGSQVKGAKLTEADIPEIIAMRKSGLTCKDIAKKKQVSATTISNITRRATWRSVKQA